MGRAGWTPGHSDSGNQGAGPSHLPSAGRGGQRAPRPGLARPSREGSSSGRPGRACSSSRARAPVVLEPLREARVPTSQWPRLPPAPGPGEDVGTGQTPAHPVASPSLRGPASLVFLQNAAAAPQDEPRRKPRPQVRACCLRTPPFQPERETKGKCHGLLRLTQSSRDTVQGT